MYCILNATRDIILSMESFSKLSRSHRIAVIIVVAVVGVAAIGGIAFYLIKKNTQSDEKLREQYYTEQRALVAPMVNEFIQSVKNTPPAILTDVQKKEIKAFVQSATSTPGITEEDKAAIAQFVKEAQDAQEQNYQTWKAEQLKKK